MGINRPKKDILPFSQSQLRLAEKWLLIVCRSLLLWENQPFNSQFVWAPWGRYPFTAIRPSRRSSCCCLHPRPWPRRPTCSPAVVSLTPMTTAIRRSPSANITCSTADRGEERKKGVQEDGGGGLRVAWLAVGYWRGPRVVAPPFILWQDKHQQKSSMSVCYAKLLKAAPQSRGPKKARGPLDHHGFYFFKRSHRVVCVVKTALPLCRLYI